MITPRVLPPLTFGAFAGAAVPVVAVVLMMLPLPRGVDLAGIYW